MFWRSFQADTVLLKILTFITCKFQAWGRKMYPLFENHKHWKKPDKMRNIVGMTPITCICILSLQTALWQL